MTPCEAASSELPREATPAVHNVHALGFGRVVLVPDWAGLAMFSGEWQVFRGWNLVRVPPRAQHSPSSQGFLL
jgi:hypothetical protein